MSMYTRVNTLLICASLGGTALSHGYSNQNAVGNFAKVPVRGYKRRYLGKCRGLGALSVLKWQVQAGLMKPCVPVCGRLRVVCDILILVSSGKFEAYPSLRVENKRAECNRR